MSFQNEIEPIVQQRILDYFNYLVNAKDIVNKPPIIDNQNEGYGDQIGDYTIGEKVARNIIEYREKLPQNRFTSIDQFENIDGLGKDKIGDIIYTFSQESGITEYPDFVRDYLKNVIDKDFHTETFEGIYNAPIYALKGITKDDAITARSSFDINSIAELLTSGLTRIPVEIRNLFFCPRYDPGPNCSWERVFSQAPVHTYESYPGNIFRTKFGPVFYRGRLNGTAKILIVGQDPSTDETLAQRAFVGTAGQRMQKLLRKVGITRSYIITNTFIFGAIGRSNDLRTASLESIIKAFREQILDKIIQENSIQAIIAFGRIAQHAVDNWPGRPNGIYYEYFTHPTADDRFIIPNWNSNISSLANAITPDSNSIVDLTPYSEPLTDQDQSSIPRKDLPFGIPSWHGTGGTRSTRNGSMDQITWEAP